MKYLHEAKCGGKHLYVINDEKDYENVEFECLGYECFGLRKMLDPIRYIRTEKINNNDIKLKSYWGMEKDLNRILNQIRDDVKYDTILFWQGDINLWNKGEKIYGFEK